MDQDRPLPQRSYCTDHRRTTAKAQMYPPPLTDSR